MTIYPDTELLLVSRIKAGLTAVGLPITSDVTVSVKKPSPDTSPYPLKIVTVRSDGGSELSRGIMRSEMVGINVYASNYGESSTLARHVESILRASASGEIKSIECTMSPVRVDNDGVEEQRYMTFRLVVKASDE